MPKEEAWELPRVKDMVSGLGFARFSMEPLFPLIENKTTRFGVHLFGDMLPWAGFNIGWAFSS